MWIIVALVVVVGCLIYYKCVKNLKYWEARGVPTLKAWPLVGNFAESVFRLRHSAYILEDLYNAFPDRRYFGTYFMTKPALFLRDPELIKKITMKEFETFPQHRSFIPEDLDPMWDRNLLAMRGGAKWQDMRATLSPSFTSSKMKMMFELMDKCAKQFTNYYLKQGRTVTLEMKDAFTRYTNDVIATTAFGVTCNSLEHQENEFYLMGKEASDAKGIKLLVLALSALSPTLSKVLKIPLFNKDVITFFKNIINDTTKMRKEQGIVRPDMIHLLMEAKEGRLKHEESHCVVDSGFAVVEESEIGKTQRRQKPEITDDDITAQALLFFIAGFESVSTLICHASYELALNPDCQEKLRKEVDVALNKSNGELTYDVLLDMKYLDGVITETLRKWPSVIMSDRESVKPFTVEPERPGEKPLHLEAGTALFIPIYCLQRDPNYYPNPNKFDPERFSDENKHNIKPGTYLPFGVGPRSCIGSRFALLEVKLVIAEIISKFEIIPVEKTPIPLLLSRKEFNVIPEEGFWLGLKPRLNLI